ncbi:MAG: hypothetical protein Q7J79_04870, partial [Gemmatimonadales bacterium]|nr:hypothetical protein [Gemmatimonadales bacterium]
HMDEIGFVVTAIRDDGQLELRRRGGFFTSLYEGEPALVHTAQGVVPAVFTPRDSVGPSPRRTPPVPLVGGTAAGSGLGGGPQSSADSVGVASGFKQVTAWALPARYPRTPVETVSLADVTQLEQRLVGFLGGAR